MRDFSACASLANCKGGGEEKMTKGAIISPLAKAAVTLTRRNNGGKITHEHHPHLVREAKVSEHPNILRRKENE